MRKLPRITIFLLIVLAIQTVVACSAFGEDADADTPEQASDPTATATSTATQSPTEAPPTATSVMTPTTTTQSTITGGSSEAITVKFTDDPDLPEVCRGEVVPNILANFVASYNAGDLDGVMNLIQEDIPGWPHSDGWEMVVHNADGEVEFKWVAMNVGKPYGFQAKTPNELRTQLAARFAAGEQFQIETVGVGGVLAQSWSQAESGRARGSWTSERMASFGMHFESYVDGQMWSPGDAKGAVDCVTGKIIMLNLGVTPPPGIRPVEGAPTVTFDDMGDDVAMEVHLEAELPDVCRNNAVPDLFKEFVRRYNAGDVDGVMEMIQQDIPDWEYSNGWELVAYDAEGMVEFKFFSMSTGIGSLPSFMAKTPEELRSAISDRIAEGEQLQLERIAIAPATTLAGPGSAASHNKPHWTSERNADFGLDFMRSIGDNTWTRANAKGTVDCEAGKIILWSSS